jgi:S-layer family protein
MSKLSTRTLSVLTTLVLVAAALVAMAAPATGGMNPFTVSLFVKSDTSVPCAGQIGDCKLNIHQSTPGATITFTVWETSAKAKLVDTIAVPNPSGGFLSIGGGGFDPGNWVEVSDGVTTKSTEIPIHEVTVDFETNVASGSAAPAGGIAVATQTKDGTEVCGRNESLDGDGNWSTDFDVAQNDGGSPSCLATWDFGPGDWIQVALDGLIDFGDIQTVYQVPDFTDDDGSIFEGDITWLAVSGITAGCNPPDNDNFCPDDNVTRGQMAAFLVRALSLTDNGGGNSFTDDDGSIFENDIAKLAAAGITAGCNPPTNDNFCPDDNVTRGQMAAFLRRALG